MSRGRAASGAPSCGPLGMDSQIAGAPALGAAEPPPGLPVLSTREAPPRLGVSAARGLGAATTCGPGREVAGLAGRAGRGPRGAGEAPRTRLLQPRRLGARPSWKRSGCGARHPEDVGGCAGPGGLAVGRRAPVRPC